MQIIIELLLLLGSSLIMGELFERYGFPGIVGNILAGFILGPALINAVKPSLELITLWNSPNFVGGWILRHAIYTFIYLCVVR
ncbi:MAG: hypothetical protein ACP5MX_03995 [Candidatus Micrarchaeia archaeon]